MTNRVKEPQVPEGFQSAPKGRSKPKVLGGDPVPRPRPLPDNFDPKAHLAVLPAGRAKAATQADFERLIEELKQGSLG